MNYIDLINEQLKPKVTKKLPVVLDLFAGCGGLSLGFEAQGFKVIGYEMDKDCCDTYRKNLGECFQTFLDEKTEYPEAEIVIGGPPCQPFSLRGKQKGVTDLRNGFPAFISAIKKVKPKIWLFENVKGLLKHKDYLREIFNELSNLGYTINSDTFNAVNFGVPQNRERIIVVGYKDGEFNFPQPNEKKVSAGEVLENLPFLAPSESKFLTASMNKYIAKYEKASKCVTPRDLHLNKPARTLTCRNLAGSTSDMQRIKLPDGRRRRLLPKEAARLQTFPDWYIFSGGETSVYNQIGNAVPPLFAYAFAGAIKNFINGEKSIIIKQQNFNFNMVKKANFYV